MSNKKFVRKSSQDAKQQTMGISNVNVGPFYGGMCYKWGFDLKHPEKVSVLMTPNGCGKSLTMRLIRDYVNGVVDPSCSPREYHIEGTVNRAILVAPLDNEYGMQRCEFDVCIDSLEVAKAVATKYNKTLGELQECFCSCEEYWSYFLDDEGKGKSKIVHKLVFTSRGHRRHFYKNKNLPQLSAGERNWIAIWHAILTSRPGDIVLLDSPETGLHIKQQDALIDGILEIDTENRGQIVIATHSPNIVNTHIELFAHRTVWYIDDEHFDDPIDWSKH